MSEYPLQREGTPVRRRPRKGLYLLPSMFTALNMAAGYYAIAQSIQGTPAEYWHFDQAAKAIGIAIVLEQYHSFAEPTGWLAYCWCCESSSGWRRRPR